MRLPPTGEALALAGALRGCRILVVEDTAASRMLLTAYLSAAGLTEVAFAADGIEALEQVESFDPDLVLLDIMMPRMDGYEVCRRLRADPRHQRLPILVQTALSMPGDRTAAFAAGATDMVTKPINGPELIARMRVHLENRLLVGRLEAYHRRVQGELALAREMQSSLLPSRADLARLAGLDIAAHFEPSSEIGGDHWCAVPLEQGKVGLVLADFAGHGITAALNAFRLHTLLGQQPPTSDPAASLARLNRALTRLLPVDQFATILYGVIDPAADRLVFATAAAPSPILLGAAAPRLIAASGLPAGISAAASYDAIELPFPPGAALFLYSDALAETPDQTGRLPDEADLLAFAAAARTADSAATGLERILAAFRHGRAPLGDDLTAVLVRRPAGPPPAG